MNKTVDMINLPVVDISEGAEIGISTRIVINPTEGSIAALAIDDGKWYLGAKLVPFSAITGIGESAITITSKSEILTLENNPAMEQLLSNDITVIDTKVLTKAGRIQGTIKELLIDASGKIISCEVEEASGEISSLPAERVMTFGKKVTVIADVDGEQTTPIVPAAAVVAPSAPQTPPTPEVEVKAPIATVPPIKEVPPVKETPKEVAKETHNDDSAKKFDEKQRRYLLGKQASRRIETDNGVVIVEQGGEINEEVLQKAKLAGKFVELSMNIQ